MKGLMDLGGCDLGEIPTFFLCEREKICRMVGIGVEVIQSDVRNDTEDWQMGIKQKRA